MLTEKTSQAEKECTRLQLSVRINILHVHVQLYFSTVANSLFSVSSNMMFLFLNFFNEPKDLFCTSLLLI